MSKKRRRLGRAQRAKISRGLKRYHARRRAEQVARRRAAKAGWRTRRAQAIRPEVRKRKAKVVRVPPPLPEAPAQEFELTRVAETRRRRGSETVQVDQTLRFVKKRGARMTPEEAREWLARGKYGPVLAAFDVVEVDWTNEGDSREHYYTTPKDVEAALDQSARMGWRYGSVRVL